MTPNLIHTEGRIRTRRPESVIAEIEENNFVIQVILENGREIFDDAEKKLV